jgi:hypothetical protein
MVEGEPDSAKRVAEGQIAPDEVTRLLNAAAQGDSVSSSQLLRVIYENLRGIAA